MEVQLTESEQALLARLSTETRKVRQWRRYQALRLLAQGQQPGQVAAALGCCRSSIYNWVADFRRDGLDGVREGVHAGRARVLTQQGEQLLTRLLLNESGRQDIVWTVPLLRTELANAGFSVGTRTIRRAMHRLGWRWKHTRFVLAKLEPGVQQSTDSMPRPTTVSPLLSRREDSITRRRVAQG